MQNIPSAQTFANRIVEKREDGSVLMEFTVYFEVRTTAFQRGEVEKLAKKCAIVEGRVCPDPKGHIELDGYRYQLQPSVEDPHPINSLLDRAWRQCLDIQREQAEIERDRERESSSDRQRKIDAHTAQMRLLGSTARKRRRLDLAIRLAKANRKQYPNADKEWMIRQISKAAGRYDRNNRPILPISTLRRWVKNTELSWDNLGK